LLDFGAAYIDCVKKEVLSRDEVLRVKMKVKQYSISRLTGDLLKAGTVCRVRIEGLAGEAPQSP
jgi:hypothetical protein